MASPVKIKDNLVDAWVNIPGSDSETFEIEVPEEIQAQGSEAVDEYIRHVGASQMGVDEEDIQFTENW